LSEAAGPAPANAPLRRIPLDDLTAEYEEAVRDAISEYDVTALEQVFAAMFIEAGWSATEVEATLASLHKTRQGRHLLAWVRGEA
jgi:hypothetical protein